MTGEHGERKGCLFVSVLLLLGKGRDTSFERRRVGGTRVRDVYRCIEIEI
jgi:hypothetical protein